MIKKVSFLFLFTFIFSCKAEKFKTIGISIFIDVTDGITETQSNIENDLLQISNFTNVSEINGGYNGIELKIFQINNLSESNSKKIVLNKGVSGMLGQNPLDRIDDIKKYNASVKDAFISIQKSNIKELPNSKIYQNLCREFNNLDLSYDKNLIIIYSDMLENSDLFSFYNYKGKMSSWEKNIDLAIEYLESKDCSFPLLKNVEIHIISKRKTQNDELINKAQSFWKKLFTAKGVNIRFDSELNIKSKL